MASLAEYCSLWPSAGGQSFYTQVRPAQFPQTDLSGRVKSNGFFRWSLLPAVDVFCLMLSATVSWFVKCPLLLDVL